MSLVERQIAVALVSGSGSTAHEIFKATRDGRLPRTDLRLVISSKPEAGSLDRFSGDSDFPRERYLIVRPEDHQTPEQYGETIIRLAKGFSADIIGQYGHTPLTPENVIVEFTNRMINQHPGPIDPSPYDFGGKGMSSAKRVHATRLQFVMDTNRNWWTEVTAQRVAVTFDGGKVLRRSLPIPISSTDTVEDLEKRAKPFELRLQIDTLSDFEEGKVQELPPYVDLVLPEERELLERIKKFVRRSYKPD